MKAFIEKIFKSKKQKQKELIDEITTEAKESLIIKAVEETKSAIEQVKKEVKEVIKKEEVKKEEVVTYPKPNHFPDCNCFKCDRWKQQNAK
jgi:hypothetical protein